MTYALGSILIFLAYLDVGSDTWNFTIKEYVFPWLISCPVEFNIKTTRRVKMTHS